MSAVETNRPSRTFNFRRGRMSRRQFESLDRFYPRYGVADEPVDFPSIFGNDRPVVLEIGSGMGDATVQMARADQQHNYLAIEVHPPGIANLMALADEQEVTNLRIYNGDAVTFVAERIPADCLAAMHVFFPDPWPKAKHHKRRLIQSTHIPLLRSRLMPGGVLRCATDWREYAEAMLEDLTADEQLVNCHDGFAPRSSVRPITKFEQRGIEAGRIISDLEFRRKSVT